MMELEVNRAGKSWVPIHTMYEWMDHLLRARITVIVIMPTGVNEKYSVAVKKGGMQLEVQVNWPDILLNKELLHCPLDIIMTGTKKNKIDEGAKNDFQVRVQEFKKHLKELEKKMEN